MKLTIKQETITCLALLAILAEVAFGWFDFGVFGASIYSFGFLMVMPGWILKRAFRWDFGGVLKQLVHIPALSLAFIYLIGLVTNTAMAAWRIPAPLLKDHILLLLIPSLVALVLVGHLKTHHTVIRKRWKFVRRQVIWSTVPIVFPILATLGATLLNNTGSNVITLIMLAAVSVWTLAVVSRREDLSEGVYLSGIFFSALALLLMTSLRSWHITGFDINQEYEVFQLTKQPLQWSMSHLQDPYNACLSITMLPTMFSQLMQLPDEYIFKLVSQVYFAIMPAALFLFSRKYINKQTAFLASFFFIGQVQFFQGMPTLVRQEFALLFFMLLVITVFDDTIKSALRRSLLVIYALAMVVSHYSTTYVAIALLLTTYVLYRLIASPFGRRVLSRAHRLNRPAKRGRPFNINLRLKLWHITLLLLCTLTWNLAITKTSGGIVQFLDHSTTNLNQVFNQATIAEAIKQALYSPMKVTLNSYTEGNFASFRTDHVGFTYYPSAQNTVSGIRLVDFTNVNSRLGATVHQFSTTIFKILKILIDNAFIVIGTLYLFVRWRRGYTKTGEYTVIALSSFILVILLLVLPGALQEYNVERLYFQQLITWGPAGVLGGLLVFRFIGSSRARYTTLASLYVLQLLFYSGFIFNFTGGPALISTTSFGEDYEKFYTHEGEVSSANWLGDHVGDQPVFTSSPGRNKLAAYAGIPATQVVAQLYPTIIDRNSYVYLTYMNTAGQKALFVFGGNEYAYSIPAQFLDDNKDKIYSNQVSSIYK